MQNKFPLIIWILDGKLPAFEFDDVVSKAKSDNHQQDYGHEHKQCCDCQTVSFQVVWHRLGSSWLSFCLTAHPHKPFQTSDENNSFRAQVFWLRSLATSSYLSTIF